MVRSVPEMLDSPAPRSVTASGTQGLALLAGSAALAGTTAILLITRNRWWAGVTASASAVGLLTASIQWGLHGGRRARFAYLVLDLAFDTSILAPIAWVARLPSKRVAILALVGLGASYVASYERARGRSLGYAGSERFLYRAVRIVLLVVGLLTGRVQATLWAFVVLTLTTAALRAWSVADQHRDSIQGERKA
jgi:hypothetical protein